MKITHGSKTYKTEKGAVQKFKDVCGDDAEIKFDWFLCTDEGKYSVIVFLRQNQMELAMPLAHNGIKVIGG